MKKKLIIFDLDGTLINTLIDLKNALNYALNAYNYPERTLEETRLFIGRGVRFLVACCIPNGDKNKDHLNIVNKFREYYYEHYLDNTLPYNGIIELLRKLRKDGYHLAVCTNKIDSIAKRMISHFFDDTFDFVLGDIDNIPKKPNPNMINIVINHFNLSKDDCIYVGDTNVDILTATNSNLDYIIVTYGYRKLEEMIDTYPHVLYVEDTDELYQKITNL